MYFYRELGILKIYIAHFFGIHCDINTITKYKLYNKTFIILNSFSDDN